MKYGTLLFFFLLAEQLFSQVEWAISIGNQNADKVEKMALDPWGNVYSVGTFTSLVDFDPGPGTVNLTMYSVNNVYVQKLDPNGNLLKVVGIGKSDAPLEPVNRAKATYVACDKQGNVFVTGTCEKTIDLDPGVGVVLFSVPTNKVGTFLVKMNSDLEYVWSKTWVSTQNARPSHIVLDDSNDVYLTGVFTGNLDIDPDAGQAIFNGSSNNPSAFLVKLAEDGTYLWGQVINTLNGDEFKAVAIDKRNNLVAQGLFQGTFDFDPGPGVNNLTQCNTQWNINPFIEKFDPNGNLLWAKSCCGLDPSDMAFDSLNNIYSIGHCGFYRDFDPDPNAVYSFVPIHNNGTNYLQALDSNGNFLYARSYGGYSSYYIPAQIEFDLENNMYIAARFDADTDIDPHPTNQYPIYGQGVYFLKLNEYAQFISVQILGDFITNSLVFHPSLNFYLSGYFSGSQGIIPAGQNQYVHSNGDSDGLVFKLGMIVGLEELDEQTISVFPNPTDGVIHLQGASANFERHIIYNLYGEAIYSSELYQSTIQLPKETLPGVYFLSTHYSDQISTTRFVVQ